MITNFGQGVSSFGMPVVPGAIGGYPIRGWAGGKVLYVGSAGWPGDDVPDNFYSTLLSALTALAGRSNKGDVVIGAPGHQENISAADYASAMGALSGVSIIGMGTGTMRPKYIWTTATSTFLCDQSNIEWANNQLYLAGPDGTGSLTVAAAMTVSGVNNRLVKNYINTGFDSGSIVAIGIDVTDAADGFEFIGNEVFGTATAVPTTAPIRIAGADQCRIIGNYIAAPSASGIGVVKFVTTAPTNVLIANNYLHNNAGSSTVVMTGVAAMTGTVSDNRCRNMTDGNNGHLGATFGACQMFENYGVNNDGETGILLGTASV